MTQLEKMIESCEEFAKNPKVGNIEFIPQNWNRFFTSKIQLPMVGFLQIYHDNYQNKFCYNTIEVTFKPLKSTAAAEAAAEALELCRKEAQKLVDLLSEPKEETAIIQLDFISTPKEQQKRYIQDSISCVVESAIIQILSKGKAKRTFLTSEYYKLMKKPLRAEDLAYLVRIGKIERVEYGVYQIKSF